MPALLIRTVDRDAVHSRLQYRRRKSERNCQGRKQYGQKSVGLGHERRHKKGHQPVREPERAEPRREFLHIGT